MRTELRSIDVAFKVFIVIIISISIMSCNFFTRKSSEESTDSSKDLYIRMIGQKINQLEFVLENRGVRFDSSYNTLNEVSKLEWIKSEIRGYRFCDYQIVRVDHKSKKIESDSIYRGSVSLSSYNSNLNWNLHLNYNGTELNIPFDKTLLEYKFKLKPYKLGKNEYNGYLVQGQDTYNFSSSFNVMK